MLTYTMTHHRVMRSPHLKELHRHTHEGAIYVMSSDMTLYIVVPLTDLFTGEPGEVWITKEQWKEFEPDGTKELHEPPCDRFHKLTDIGLVKPKDSRNPKKIMAFTSDTHSMSVIKDKEGHFWQGDYDRFVIMAVYDKVEETAPYRWPKPKLRFVFPYLNYLGPPKKALWKKAWGDEGELERLTFCTQEVQKAIVKTGAFGTYFPEGSARTNVSLATQEATATWEKQMGNVKEALILKKKEVTTLQSDLEGAKEDNHVLQKEHDKAIRKITALEAQLEENAAQPEAVSLLQKQLEQANMRADTAEKTLGTAREENSGWDWSKF